jgi:hypothetical protein
MYTVVEEKKRESIGEPGADMGWMPTSPLGSLMEREKGMNLQ